MLVLGIESTCDETGCSVVRDGKEVLSNLISSQIPLHAKYGGVIPELASRRHVDVIADLTQQALNEANVTLEQIDLIAVAKGPGLIGALLVGIHFAKGLSLATGIPLIGVNHVEAHLYSPFMEEDVPLPALGLVVSGGHTALLLVRSIGDYQLIGETQDDAIGEAFDKVGALLQLPYPGGPQIERLAKTGNPHRYPFKAGQIKGKPYDFSFSGLKTSVLYQVKGQNASKTSPLALSENEKSDVAASFQHIAFQDIVNKSILAAKEFECQSIVAGGGVTHNHTLRRTLSESTSLPIFWPKEGLCLDNAAMIAGLGFARMQEQGSINLLSLNDLEPQPRMNF